MRWQERSSAGTLRKRCRFCQTAAAPLPSSTEYYFVTLFTYVSNTEKKRCLEIIQKIFSAVLRVFNSSSACCRWSVGPCRASPSWPASAASCTRGGSETTESARRPTLLRRTASAVVHGLTAATNLLPTTPTDYQSTPGELRRGFTWPGNVASTLRCNPTRLRSYVSRGNYYLLCMRRRSRDYEVDARARKATAKEYAQHHKVRVTGTIWETKQKQRCCRLQNARVTENRVCEACSTH